MPIRPRAPALLAATAAFVALAATAQPRFSLDTTPTLLPKSVLPQKVELLLDLDPASDTFRGESTLSFTVREPVAALAVHAAELEGGEARLLDPAGDRAMVLESDPAHSIWRWRPADGRPIAAGTQRLAVSWRGHVKRTGEGLFAVDHRVDGKPARMLVTQLEAINARHVFPVMDEPVFRTPFVLSVRAPAGDEVIANMPEASREPQGGKVLHRFAPTPPMQSYLVAFAVGRFDRLEGRAGDLPLRMFTAPGKGPQAQFALAATQQLMPWYGGYFGQPYPLPKLDQLAVPGVLNGAMENWGLVIYNEAAMLYDPARSTAETQRRVHGVVAHELAHQWFGNLVSPAGWGEAWLNESFATWMEHKATLRFHPEWNTPLRTRRDLERTMDRDATAGTRPIRSGPVMEGSVFEVFDDITYTKGGSVLTMLEDWLGEDTFRRGLQGYMAERRMQPATAGDLWHHFGQVADAPVAAVAASWTDQAGIPRVSVATRCEGGALQVTLAQQRFTLGDALPPQRWRIPVRLARGDEARTVMLDGERASLAWPGCDGPAVRANAGGLGYYRVEYDTPSRHALAGDFAKLPMLDRLAVLGDSFAMAKAGHQPLAAHFDWLATLPQVGGPGRAALYQLAAQQLGELRVTLHGTPAAEALRRAAVALLAPELQRLGWAPRADEDTETLALRTQLIESLARFGDQATLAAARERFDAALAGAPSVPVAMRTAVLVAGARGLDDAGLTRLLQAAQRADGEEERNRLQQALGEVPQALLPRVLDAAIAGTLPQRMASTLPRQLGPRPDASELVYAHIASHWAAWRALAGDGILGAHHWLLPMAASGSVDPQRAAQLRRDQQTMDGEAGKSAAERVAASLEVRQRVRQRDAAPLAQALAGWAPRDTALR